MCRSPQSEFDAIVAQPAGVTGAQFRTSDTGVHW
jgi:hypothetical protein